MKEGWEYKKLGEVCEILDSQRRPVTKRDRKEGIYPYYGASGIQDFVDSYIFDGRYLLVGEDGAKWGSLDKSAYIVEGKCWVNNHAHILQINDIIIDRLLEYYLVFEDLTMYITGAIVPKLTQKALVNIEIPVPPRSIQKQIVSELDLLSGIVEKQKAQLEELDKLAQSIFYDMFGDPVTNEKGWELKKLDSLCASKKDIIRVNKLYSDNDIINYIDISSVNNKTHTIQSTSPFLLKDAPSRAQQAVDFDDIIISTVRPNLKNIAKINIKERNLVASSGFCVLRTNKNSVYFLLNLLMTDSFTNYLIKRVTGANYPAVKEDDIKKCNIGIPPLFLQQEFAAKVEAIEAMKAKVRQSLKEAETLFNERMDYYFN